MSKPIKVSFFRRILQKVFVVVGSIGLALVCFLVLPLIQAIAQSDEELFMVEEIDVANLPTPEEETPEPEPEEPEEEEEPEPETDDSEPLSLAELELSLSDGFGVGFGGNDFGIKLNTLSGGEDGDGGGFDFDDFDDRPTVLHEVSPTITPDVRRHTPGEVWVIATIDREGRVQNPKIWRSKHPALEKPVLEAFQKWKYKPGKRPYNVRKKFTFPDLRS